MSETGSIDLASDVEDSEIDQCRAEIEKLSDLIRKQQRRLDAQELLIEELCQAHCDVCLPPEAATRVFSREVRRKKERLTSVMRTSALVSAIMFGVVSKVLYSHYQLQCCFQLFHEAAKDYIPELEDIDFGRLSPLYFSPASGYEASTAPLWFILNVFAFVFSALLQIAASIVDKILRTIILVSVIAGGVVFLFKNFDSIMQWIREDKEQEPAEDSRIPSASIGGRDVSASPLLNTQQLASTRNCTEMSVSDLSDEEASTRSTINFTGPVTRQRAKANVERMTGDS